MIFVTSYSFALHMYQKIHLIVKIFGVTQFIVARIMAKRKPFSMYLSSRVIFLTHMKLSMDGVEICSVTRNSEVNKSSIFSY